MSRDSFTEVTHQSWFGRIGKALAGVLVGLLFFVGSFPVLFWGEGRAVERYKTLKEGGGVVISVPSDPIDTNNEGRLVHVTGTAHTNATLSDPLCGMSAKAIKLKRVVEMYQWEETSRSKTKKKFGGGTETITTYTYKKTWSDKAISSSGFKEVTNHENPGSIPFESLEQVADVVTLGAYSLSSSLIRQINNFRPFPPGNDAQTPTSLGDNARQFDGGYYVGADPTSPQIGDVRVKFQIIQPTAVSVIARQTGNTFEPYHAKAGGEINLLEVGQHSPEAMIKQAQESNMIMTWIIRLAGFIFMFLGLALILRPLSVLADVVPVLGTLLGVGTGIISFLSAMILSLLIISFAWFAYRPILAILLVAVSACLMIIAIILQRRRKRGTLSPHLPMSPSSPPPPPR